MAEIAQQITSAEAALSELRSCLPQALDALADSPSDASCAELERILGQVTEAYGRVRLARENGTYAGTEDRDGIPPEFPIPLTATAVMIAIDRLLQGANLNTFELALWQHVGRYDNSDTSSY